MMASTRQYIFFFFVLMFSPSNAQIVEKLWDSPRKFVTPESVCYSREEKIIYVSNINGNSSEKDNNGFISILDLNGKIINRKWITGLNAPKGMAIYNGKLFVSDIDQVVEIDIKNKKIEHRYEAENAKFLNDLCIDSFGNVYVSDMMTGCIYKLTKDDKDLEKWFKVKCYKHPNGLLVKNGELLIGVDKHVIKVNLQDKTMDIFIPDTGEVDGLVAINGIKYFISDWQGSTHLIQPGKEKIKITDTQNQNINAADIDFIEEKGILLIPTFFDNRVSAYKITF